LTKEDFAAIEGEVLVFLKVFDDMYSATVVKRTSYSFNEIVFGAKFSPMFSKSDNQNKTILHIDKLNLYEKIKL